MMSDLRESGAIEQDADIIAFLYREEYYLRDKTPEDKIGIAEIILAKHRNGPVGSIELRFFNNITRFENLDREHDGYAP
jgi:replicative DNA helicase